MSTTDTRPRTNTATVDQVEDIKYLLAELEARGFDFTGTRRSMNDSWSKGAFTVELAADMIKMMLDARDLNPSVPQQRTASPAQATTVDDGRYAIRTNEGHYAFYRVRNTRTETIVYQQVSDAEGRIGRAAAATVLSRIADDPKEAAIAYGRELGVCHCGRTLTNPDSIARGIGPICATKL